MRHIALFLGLLSLVPTALFAQIFTGKVGVNIPTPSYVFQVATTTVPTVWGIPYINIGGSEFATGALQTIGFGFNSATRINPPVEIGYRTTNTSGGTFGDFVVGTRSTSSAVPVTEKFTVTSGGNVGVGTKTPSQPLEVNNGDYGAAKFGYSATIGATTQSGNADVVIGRNTIASPTANAMNIVNTNPAIGAQAIYMSNGGIGFHTQSGSVTAGTAFSSERVRIDANGNVGIGASVPKSLLNVIGATKTLSQHQMLTLYSNELTALVDTGGSLGFGGNYTTGGALAGWAGIAGNKENSTSGNFAGYLQFNTRPAGGGGLVERVRIDSTGNVGIGTTTPKERLEVAGNVKLSGNIVSDGDICIGLCQ